MVSISDAMPRLPSVPVTRQHLARMHRDVAEAFPDADASFLAYAVASEVVINVLGPAWWGTRLAGSAPDPYFVKHGDNETARFLHLHRVVALAQGLLACQELRGFWEQLDKMRTRDVIGVFHELRAARLINASGHAVEFVTPTGTKGADFDLLVDDQLAVEVEAKQDATEFSSRSLRGALAHARKQLPSDGPGFVVLRIPDAWGEEPATGLGLEEAIRRELHNSRRVNAVVVVFDQRVRIEPEGMAFVTRSHVYENDEPRTPFADITQIVRAIGPHSM